jgi:flagellar motor component MotA
MNQEDFEKEYNVIEERAFFLATTARQKGILQLEEEIIDTKYIQRDICEYGLQFVVDGVDKNVINKILTNIVDQEPDKDKKLLKNIQKEAILAIQAGVNPLGILLLVNSYVTINIKDVLKKCESLKIHSRL